MKKIRRLIAQNLKINFYKLILYHLKENKWFLKIYADLIIWHSALWYFLIVKVLKLHKKNGGEFIIKYNIKCITYLSYGFKYLGIILLTLSFCFDIIMYSYDLIFLKKILPWVGLYHLLYKINNFLSNQLDLKYDLHFCDLIYPPGRFFVLDDSIQYYIETKLYLEKTMEF